MSESTTSDRTDGAEVEVDCPGCGWTVVGTSPRPSAEWFCPSCDYPLFWAAVPADDEERTTSRAARRRLPGSGGRRVVGAQPCWHCGEMSEAGDDACRRCAAALPKPMAPVVEVERVVEVEVEVPQVVTLPVWPFVAAAALGTSSAAVALTLLLTGAYG